MTKAERILMLLERYGEANEPLQRGGIGISDPDLRGLLLMPSVWNESFRELERRLRQLRSEQPSVYAHVRARYLTCQRRQRVVQRRGGRWIGLSAWERVVAPNEHQLATEKVLRATNSRGVPTAVPLKAIVESWQPWVEARMLEKGLELLADWFRGEPYLPKAMLAA